MRLSRRRFLGVGSAGLAGWCESGITGLLAEEAGGVVDGVLGTAPPGDSADFALLKGLWDRPGRTHKPHTRWWWPGNALSREDITRQLEGMAGQRIGGVEIMSLWKMYEKGNVEYLTPKFLALVKHAVAEAKRLDMDVAITFSPGWGFGGAWVPLADQSKVLCLSSKDVAAGATFDGPLPVLWHDVGPLTPRIRYDVGEYLSYLGLETFFKPFNEWCDKHHVQARIQPHYRFSEELVQGAGSTARPETEVTTARFEPVADPRKATASGARFYGREIVSAEAYTFIHPLRYRTNLQDLKIATDAFLRDGITQFYNHGYFGSPEAHVAPSGDFPWANRIDPWNTWWPHYHFVAAYVARCCAVLRQGRLVADELIYSPQASAWSERAVWGSTRRVMPYGNLAKTLVANGYDFDIVNDDLLQHRTTFRDGRLTINGHAYRLLLLPRATVLPIETLRKIRDFVKAGGTVVALDELPASASGLKDHEANDLEMRQIIHELFSSEAPRLTGGVFLPEYKIDRKPFNPGRQAPAPTPPLDIAQRRLLGVLKNLTPPDFALAGRLQSDGLTFIHKQMGEVDVYFASNLQASAVATEVTFRVTGKKLQRWDALTGKVEDIRPCRVAVEGTSVVVEFEAWESAFFVFWPGEPLVQAVEPGVQRKPLDKILLVSGIWQMRLEGYGFETYETTCEVLASWTDTPRTRHFSGTGRYQIEFEVPARRVEAGTRVLLDLGEVGNLAEVELNGQAAGVAWMHPYRLDVSRLLRAGSNTLVLRVSDALINYVSGLKEPTEVPEELQARLGKANAEIYPEGGSAKQEMSETDLPPSGLIGPVRLLFH